MIDMGLSLGHSYPYFGFIGLFFLFFTAKATVVPTFGIGTCNLNSPRFISRVTPADFCTASHFHHISIGKKDLGLSKILPQQVRPLVLN